MGPDADRRISVRTSCSGCMRIARFNRSETVTASLVDFSGEGLGFRSAADRKPGNALLVQVEPDESAGSKEPAGRPARSLGMVEVKCCRPVGDRWNTAYAIGAAYLLP